MPFDYFNRLSAKRQRIYLESDRITQITLPGARLLRPLVRQLEDALSKESRPLTQEKAQQLVTAITESLKLKPLSVKVLQKRPSSTWGELQGLYEPGDHGAPDRITVWMRTARRKDVVAFKTFLRTLIHELCHYLDYELLGLKETFHTEGFFKRESSLFHQLMEKQ